MAVIDLPASSPARTDRAGLAAAAGRLAARAVREPLLHFVLAGLALYALAVHHREQSSLYRIVVTPERASRLADDYRQQFGAPPTPAGLQALVDKYVDEEVLFREGIAMGLDRDDEIVRRRVVQKMQFLEQDLAAPREPSEPTLEAYYQAHLARYAHPGRITFTHIYFSPERGGDEAARRRAVAALARLTDAVPRAPDRGDAFADLYDYAGFGQAQARRLFGDSDLARRLFQAPAGHWVGPYRSAYGWHLIRIRSATASETPPLSEVRDQVRADLIAADGIEANRKSFAALKARFTVVRQDQGARR